MPKTLAECSSFAKYMGHYVFACRNHKDAEVFKDKTLEEIILLIEADMDSAVAQGVERHNEHVKKFLSELAEYLGVEDGAKFSDFIPAAAKIRQDLSDSTADKARLDWLENQPTPPEGSVLETLHLSKCFGGMGRSWFQKLIRKCIDDHMNSPLTKDPI